MRISPKRSSRWCCLMRWLSASRTLFSKPEYVWITYHFLLPPLREGGGGGASAAAAAAVCLLLGAGAIDQVGDERPEAVEEGQIQRGNRARRDDHDRGVGD